MYSARPEDKENTDPMSKVLAEKVIDRLVTVLFVFTSWITSRYNTPGLNWKIVTDFCTKYAFSSPSRKICCTVIDVEVGDDKRESAESAGVTLIPARRKSSLDHKRHPPKLEWLLNHEIHYPRLGDLENVKYVVGHDSMTADAARDIRDSLFPDAELHLLKVDLPGVLVVFDKWDVEKYGLPELHRLFLKFFGRKNGNGVKVYATILDVTISEAQREDAEKAGITLIPARRAEHLDPEDDPINIRWLSYPDGYYPLLRDLRNIQYVIGYAPMTAKAAANVRKSLFPQAKLYQINAIHPDYYATMTSEAQSKLERNMLNIAKEADAMVSIGPSMYDYFENAYRAIHDKAIPHIELLPRVGECFRKQAIELQENIPQHVILSYGELDCHADIISDYGKIASTLGKVAAAQEEVRGHSIKWNILDVPTESVEANEKDLNKLTLCDFEFAKLKPTATISQLLTHFQQSHLCIMCSRRTDFGFYGLESIAAGLPTYVYRDSQLGAFIIKYLKAYKDLFLVRSEQDCHDKVIAAIEDTDTALKWASELKKAYLECKEVDQSYSRFAALFTDEKEPSEDLPVTIELDTQPWKQRLKELREQREMVSRQRPDDQTTLDALTQEIQKVSENLQCLKRKADQMIEDESAKLKRLCCDANVGVNQVTKIFKGSLGMLLNFLSILGLYRFKSSVQTGRFAELYEPWLITDEMREIAEKVNLPLKLQVTYEEKKFDELDAFFISRDGSISDSLKNVDGHNVCRFVKQPQSSLLVEQQSFKANADTEETIPLARRLILFKHDRVLQSQRMTALCLLQILNIGNSADIKHITCDVIQVQVQITERIRRILLSKQEILSLLGIKAFLITDTVTGGLTTGALAAQSEMHGTTVSAITTTHRSLLVRGLLLFDISQPKVGSYCDLCFLDLEETGRQRDRQTQVLKAQLHNIREENYSLEEQHKKTLRELDRAIKEVKHLKDELDNTLKGRGNVEKQRNQAKQDAEFFKTQLDEVKEGKSVLDKQNQERIEELGKAEKVATEKAIEITSLKKEIHELETKLAESSDLVTKMKEKLSDTEIRATESDAIKDEFDNARKENVHLKDQLDKVKKVITQLEDQLEITIVEKSQIQEELDRERKKKILPQAAGKETDDLEEKEVKDTPASSGPHASITKPNHSASKRYIGRKQEWAAGRYDGGHKWTLQVLGSDESGTEPGQFNSPNGLAWHGDQLVICDTENHRIQILNKNKVVIEIITFDGQFDKEFTPYAVVISPDGHFFITDIGNNQIIICDHNKEIIQIITQSADIEVRSITVMATFIFVTDSKGNSLIKYNIKDGKRVARVSDQFSNPHSVMATSNNHLLVSDRDKHVIHVLDSDLNFQNSYHNDSLKYPQGLDVDSHSNIYICTWPSNGIVKLRSDGQLDCVLFEGDVYYPEFIAVSDAITTTIAITEWMPSSLYLSEHQIKVYSVST